MTFVLSPFDAVMRFFTVEQLPGPFNCHLSCVIYKSALTVEIWNTKYKHIKYAVKFFTQQCVSLRLVVHDWNILNPLKIKLSDVITKLSFDPRTKNGVIELTVKIREIHGCFRFLHHTTMRFFTVGLPMNIASILVIFWSNLQICALNLGRFVAWLNCVKKLFLDCFGFIHATVRLTVGRSPQHMTNFKFLI